MTRLLFVCFSISILVAWLPMKAESRPGAQLDTKRMMETVEILASDEYEGRGINTSGLSKTADTIAALFQAIGLEPGGDQDYFQAFSVEGPEGEPVRVRNVVGMIPARSGGLAGGVVVLSAHYDHLGHGWPDVRDGFEGQIHPGADDNASGVAVMLELAHSLVESSPERGIVFLATSAEESGLLGARHYLKTVGDSPAEMIIANVNLDTVGRAGAKIMVFGGASASEWPELFASAGIATGVETDLVKQEITASDHTAFLEAGIPAVHLFGSATGDYHRPSDTADKIDPASLLRVAALTRELVLDLASRTDPLNSTIAAAAKVTKPRQPAGKRKGRTVSTGTMPDFAYEGEGIRVKQLAEGSPGALAGLRPGDVITGFGGVPVKDLQAYTIELIKYDPGNRVKVAIDRDGEALVLELVLAKR